MTNDKKTFLPHLRISFILGKIVRQFINSQPQDVRVAEGVHLISTRSENDARAIKDDGTVLGSVENYLQTHEVRIKLQELMPGEGLGRAIKEALSDDVGK